MTDIGLRYSIAMLFSTSFLIVSCTSEQTRYGNVFEGGDPDTVLHMNSGTDSDNDADTDSDTDNDADSDSDSDSDTDNDTDTDTDSDTDNDTDSDSDTDTDTDTDSDSDTDIYNVQDTASTDDDSQCGGNLEYCCNGNCGPGFDPIVNPLDQTCMCQKPCTFKACNAGSIQGFCVETSENGMGICVNDLDTPLEQITLSNCTEDKTCTTESSVSEGTACVDTMTSALKTVKRCVVLCENTPTECDASSLCAGAVTMGISGVTLDYTNGHCSPLSLLQQ